MSENWYRDLHPVVVDRAKSEVSWQASSVPVDFAGMDDSIVKITYSPDRCVVTYSDRTVTLNDPTQFFDMTDGTGVGAAVEKIYTDAAREAGF